MLNCDVAAAEASPAPQEAGSRDGPSELPQFNFDIAVISVSFSPSGLSTFGIIVKKAFQTQVTDSFSNIFFLFVYIFTFSQPLMGKVIINK